ncbi:dicarboxylate/amino acid:cation symporter [Agitococcus lubricus]|uniref:Na+/H+-dicarboxylate symporter n=1 Tax=Agitococcus lubricus TaxID=1077255 RepID=A0A2T5J3L1_9GAMM|nr:dicarboxylate/amino acid:cation symporter [Agitococcus lubricus]PTQ91209.1 Na+/H+-dicarboxylate symporter [Agitococcus lubricus]
MSLNNRILLGALIGLILGYGIRNYASSSIIEQSVMVSTLIASLFVGLLKMVLLPLVFSSITLGVANLRAHQQMHRVWQLTLLCFASTTCIAITLGLSAAHLFETGAGLSLPLFQAQLTDYDASQLSTSEFLQKLVQGIFMNPFAALAQGNILAVVSFALFVGIVLAKHGDNYPQLKQFFQEAFQLCMQLITWIMYIAPLGIMALFFKLVVSEDSALLSTLIEFIAVVIGTTLVHGLIVLPLILYMFTRVNPWQFWQGAKPALITAFATSSSAATIPVTLKCVQEDLKVSPKVAGFVIPLGAQINMDGTALYEAAAALFVANLVGIDLSLGQQVIVCLTVMLASIGAPGIPSAGMVTMVMVLQSVGLPAEAVAILIPIDRLLDTVRTMVNVEGDMVTSLIVNKHTH